MAMFTEDILQKYPSLKKFEDPNYDEWKDGREVRLLNAIYSHPNLEEIRGNPAKILAVMDDFARDEDFLINIGPHKAEILAELILKEKPRVTIELGAYVGYSAVWFAHHMRQAAGSEQTGLRLWSLEFEPLFAAITMSIVDLAGVGDIVKVVTGKADESLKRLSQTGKADKVDFLFLDHEESLYVSDLKAAEALGLVQPGTLIVADNVVRPGAPEYREYVRTHPKMQSEGVRGLIIPGDGEDEMEVSRIK